MLLELFLSLTIISLASLVGVFSISVKNIDKYLEHLVSLSVGALLGGAFIHLIPELAKEGLVGELSIFILVGIILFFVLEKFIFLAPLPPHRTQTLIFFIHEPSG